MDMKVGDVFGALTVLEITKSTRRPGYKTKCRCTCGRVLDVRASRLYPPHGHWRSCQRRACDRRFRKAGQPATKISKGYREVLVKRRWILEHRFVMSEELGRQLEPHEHVHHINGDRLDNRLCNLEVVDQRTHSRKHRDIYKEFLRLRRENKSLRKEVARLKNGIRLETA
jgi:hypothetical protein